MKTKWIVMTVMVVLCGMARAEDIFSDDFSVNGPLNGSTPDIGGTWDVDSGSFVVSGGVVSTFIDPDPAYDIAFGSFTRALTAGETLTLTFETTTSGGTFSGTGWAGISLYENAVEKVFLGGPAVSEWGTGADLGVNVFSPSITAAAQTAVFNYVFNTGSWDFTVASQQISGTTTANLAFDQIRIGADIDNIKDIAVSGINVSVVPEPASAMLVILGAGVGLLIHRARRFAVRR